MRYYHAHYVECSSHLIHPFFLFFLLPCLRLLRDGLGRTAAWVARAIPIGHNKCLDRRRDTWYVNRRIDGRMATVDDEASDNGVDTCPPRATVEMLGVMARIEHSEGEST